MGRQRKMNILMVGVLVVASLFAFAGFAADNDFSSGFSGAGSMSTQADPAQAQHEQMNDAAAKAAAAAAGKPGGTAAPVAATGQTETGSYTLGAGDKVRVTVFGEDDLSGEFDVGSDGSLALPLTGQMQVAGKTPHDVEQMYTEKLGQGYLVNPRVNVEVLNFRPFFILGEVNKPGSYPYVNGMTVISAVALGGGYTARAVTGKVYIKRASDPQKREVEVPEDAKVFPGDIIRVDERFF
jgi:polysaccharide export outer membrane protein